MSDQAYVPPKVWVWESQDGGRFTNINRPIAGPTHDHELPVGEHPLQLYSLATPNGVKVTVMLEELLELGHDAEYDAWIINIGKGDQFGSGFVDINPNSKSLRCSIGGLSQARVCSNQVPFSCISPRSLVLLCQQICLRERSVTHGSCGKWAALLT